MKNLVFFTFFLILITFSVHQNAIAETEEEKERKKAIEEAADHLKRKIVNEKPIEEILCLHCWCLQNNIACCGEDDEE